MVTLILLTPLAFAQTQTAPETPRRDTEALNAIQASVLACGGVTPSDAVLTGTYIRWDGETGAMTAKFKGLDQTSQSVVASAGERKTTVSRGAGQRSTSNSTKAISAELAASSGSVIFPLPLLVNALNNPDFSAEYVGVESIEAESAYHVRIWNTYNSNPKWSRIAKFTRKDIWISSTTGLPLRIAFEERAASGAVPGFAVQLDFSDFRSANGVVAPFRIHRMFNGSEWGTISISQVQLNVGLPDSEFSIQ